MREKVLWGAGEAAELKLFEQRVGHNRGHADLLWVDVVFDFKLSDGVC